ncbi:hypothetical protein XH80_00980 [Bradyrhizobium sp. CCBAU 45384]|nr:hypothetical protein [Bradyrhizobium sp. CCBAU 45384]
MCAEVLQDTPMKTAWTYVNTSKQVGDKNHIKAFATIDAAEKWFEENDPGAWRSCTRFSNEPYWTPGLSTPCV